CRPCSFSHREARGLEVGRQLQVVTLVSDRREHIGCLRARQPALGRERNRHHFRSLPKALEQLGRHARKAFAAVDEYVEFILARAAIDRAEQRRSHGFNTATSSSSSSGARQPLSSAGIAASSGFGAVSKACCKACSARLRPSSSGGMPSSLLFASTSSCAF